ncbi:SRPBCC family protein [Nocardioides speluncae]|uniref:SRPBCC family protein n=1 Tax=Nocardioides speluncae TaxID=2670337 RepID=UPI001F0C4816|nr:SRPBCC family protein [Nocardioides speluncae]
MSREFSFRDEWTVAASMAEVQAALVDLEHYPSWWPQVRAVLKLGPDDALVVCRSLLPYSLQVRLHAVHRLPDLLETVLDGDLEGVARWRLTPVEGGTHLRFEQDVRVTGRLLGFASYAVRPLLTWNHDRMMAGCIAGLRSRLA